MRTSVVAYALARHIAAEDVAHTIKQNSYQCCIEIPRKKKPPIFSEEMPQAKAQCCTQGTQYKTNGISVAAEGIKDYLGSEQTRNKPQGRVMNHIGSGAFCNNGLKQRIPITDHTVMADESETGPDYPSDYRIDNERHQQPSRPSHDEVPESGEFFIFEQHTGDKEKEGHVEGIYDSMGYTCQKDMCPHHSEDTYALGYVKIV